MILKIHTAVGTRIKGIIISFVHNILYVSNLYCEYAQNKQYFYSIRKSQILNVFKELKKRRLCHPNNNTVQFKFYYMPEDWLITI